jgi:predicted HicB family RNase H-like nuclease
MEQMPARVNSGEVPYPDEKRIGLRLPGALHTRLEEQAERNDRSLNEELVYLLRLGLSVQQSMAALLQGHAPDR